MPYLHNHKDFPDLLRILDRDTGIQAGLIEKDYWIMHVLYGLKKQGFNFELKGGTSLSKAYKIINRFSEDIDIHIHPPKVMNVEEDGAKNTPRQKRSRQEFYDWLAKEIKIDGIVSIERDHAFDDTVGYRSGGIRLNYEAKMPSVSGAKEGILLEVGFDDVTPNETITISSWAFDKGASTIDVIDNRAKDIVCYRPGYTFVEKLQTIATKFRQEAEDGNERSNYMRQYYDVYCLLENEEVLKFIGTEQYKAHKQRRFPKKDIEIPIKDNQAFLIDDNELRAKFTKRYENTKALYYKGQPDFNEILKRIRTFVDKL